MAFDLQLGAVDLLGASNTTPGWWFEAVGDDMDLGIPDPTVREVTSFLQDGGIEVTESYGNREMALPLVLRGTSADVLADGEAALVAEVGITNTLTLTPSGNGAPVLFDVVNSSLAASFDDVAETNALRRKYTLTVKALPFVRTDSFASTSMSPPPGTSPTTASVDACTSTTGWAATRTGGSATVTTSGGAVRATWTNTSGAAQNSGFLTMTRTGLSVNMSATPYLRVDWGYSHYASRNGTDTQTVKINGNTVAPVNVNGTVSWYPFSGTLTSVALTNATPLSAINTASITVYVADITRSSQPRDASGARQNSAILGVLGSARTPGNLALSSASNAGMGSVLVYTTPIDTPLQQPPLRAMLTSGNTQTADSTLVSGASSDLTVLHGFDIPASNIPPGGYVLMARIKNPSGTAYGITWDGKSMMGFTALDGNPPNGITGGNLAASNSYQIVPVGRMTLPTANMGSSGFVRVELQSSNPCTLDEAWLFNMDLGRLTWAECGTGAGSAGGSSSQLWLDAPSLASPVPQVYMGSATDRSDSHGDASANSVGSFGAHEFHPPATNVFVVTSGATDVTVTLSGYPRFQNYVAT